MSAQVKAVIFDQGGVLSLGGEKGTNKKAAARVNRYAGSAGY